MGPASKLVITTQPVGGVSGGLLATQPVVKVEDAGGNVVTSSSAVDHGHLVCGQHDRRQPSRRTERRQRRRDLHQPDIGRDRQHQLHADLRLERPLTSATSSNSPSRDPRDRHSLRRRRSRLHPAARRPWLRGRTNARPDRCYGRPKHRNPMGTPCLPSTARRRDRYRNRDRLGKHERDHRPEWRGLTTQPV